MRAAVAASLCICLSACNGTNGETTEAAVTDVAVSETVMTTVAVEEPIRACMIFADSSGDGSYNDRCAKGAGQAAADFDIELESYECSASEEGKSDFLRICEEGYDLIICTAPEIADYVYEYGSDYPDVKFAVMNAEVDLPNVWSVFFEQKDAYFLAGAAAAMFTEMTDIAGVNDEAVIGWIGGMDIPILQDYYAGYEHGAKYINPDVMILQSYAGEWFNSEKSYELAAKQVSQGADVVMNVVFDTDADSGVLYAVASADEEPFSMETVFTMTESCVDRACYLAIQSVAEDTFAGGTSGYLSLKDGGVRISDFSALEERCDVAFLQEITEMCEELAEKIAAGEITVGDCEEEEPVDLKE